MSSVAEALHAAFGSDSDEATFVRSDAVPGLVHWPSFLSASEQAAALSAFDNAGWLGGGRNQAMRFGADFAPGVHFLCNLIERAASEHGLLPAELLSRQPLFNQLILNTYEPGDGLASHIDLAAFADGIASLSFGAACVFDFFNASSGVTHSILLRPGDLLLLAGAARFDWFHGIKATRVDLWQGRSLERGCRVSLTLRWMDCHELTQTA